MLIKTNERLIINGILNLFKGSLSDLSMVLEDLKKLKFTKEEIENLKIEEVKDEAGNIAIKWDEEKATEMEIELSEASLAFIKKFIDEKSEKGELTLLDKEFIDVRAKVE
jgi:hypothetical protein